MANILIIGAGISGLWQAATLARDGHDVRLLEQSAEPFAEAASWLGGAMIAPNCESESAEPIIAELGRDSVAAWREICPQLKENGSLVVATPRDQAELGRFARMTSHYEQIGPEHIKELEPALAERFGKALFYPSEAHIEPGIAMPALLQSAKNSGARAEFGAHWDGSIPPDTDYVIDCRGMTASTDLPELRGVRGEMLVIQSDEISLSRPVRLLHPRFPLYIVPWSGSRFMVGATMIESEDASPVSLRSALDLLGLAYTLHPAFGEARIATLAAGLRPAFPDNIPKVLCRGRHLLVNGFYRHGYLLAPVLARLVADYIRGRDVRQDVFIEDRSER